MEKVNEETADEEVAPEQETPVEMPEVKVKGSKYCPLRKEEGCLVRRGSSPLEVPMACTSDANSFPEGCPLPARICRLVAICEEGRKKE